MIRVLYRSEILENCTGEVYQRGMSLYQMSRLGPITEEHTDTALLLTAEVTGLRQDRCHASVKLLPMRETTDRYDIGDYSCDCRNTAWYGMCVHCAALALAYSDSAKRRKNTEKAFLEAPQPDAVKPSSPFLEDVLRRYSATEQNAAAGIRPGDLHIHPVFQLASNFFTHGQALTVELRAGADKPYVVKSIPMFLHSVLHGTGYQYGKRMTVYHSPEMFDPVSQQMLTALADTVREEFSSIDTDFYCADTGTQNRRMRINPAQGARLIELAAQAEGTVTFEGNACRLVHGNPPLELKFQEEEDGSGAQVHTDGLERLCAEPYGYYLYMGVIYACTPEFQERVLPLLHSLHATEGQPSVTAFLSKNDYMRFCASVLPNLTGLLNIETGTVDFTDYMPKTPEFRFFLTRETDDGSIEVRPEVSYGSASFQLMSTGSEYRNPALEQPAITAVETYFPHGAPAPQRCAVGDDEAFLLLSEGIEKLRGIGDVMIDDSARTLRWTGTPNTTLGVALEGDLIDITLEADGYSIEEINQILDAYRLKKRYYRLRSGEFLSLTEGGLAAAARLSDALNLRYDKNGRARTERFRAQYINSIIEQDNSGITVQRNADFRKQVRALRDYRDSDYELPAGLNATLRSYQRAGYRWLCALSELGLGGILADDMGLGKTLQALAYALYIDGKTLIVCPASLIYNWENECRRFAPELRTYIVRGTPEQRAAALEGGDGLYITSYDQLRRDVTLYEKLRFACCILDEAQYIRNAATKAAKAVKELRADHRFALTGTPIENRLSDLWSIFDFLMPGYLYAYASFRTRFELPAVGGDTDIGGQLAAMAAPFILRRKKKDVLQELPDKVENRVYVEMSSEQRRLYDAQEQALRLSLQNTPEAEFLHKKIEFLAALTRLRQLCCAPELYLEDYSGGSGKQEACMELLKESAGSGHRTLVFSQFTGMLDLLAAAAEKEGLRWLYLSGKTSSEERIRMVNTFQSGTIDVFFISLKAGGTGLNLTAADRVIHYDPWWNAAAEDQASDRTHRIGQKNTVFVTKLVCRDTIEERILDLQDRKRALSDLVVSREGLQSGTLDRDELLSLLESRNNEA